jgi:hypothetical protein
MGMVWAYALFSIAAAPIVYQLAAMLINLGISQMLHNLARLSCATAVMTLCAYGCRTLTASCSPVMQLAVTVPVSVAVYVGALRLFRVLAFAEVCSLLKERRSGPRNLDQKRR